MVGRWLAGALSAVLPWGRGGDRHCARMVLRMSSKSKTASCQYTKAIGTVWQCRREWHHVVRQQVSGNGQRERNRPLSAFC